MNDYGFFYQAFYGYGTNSYYGNIDQVGYENPRQLLLHGGKSRSKSSAKRSKKSRKGNR